MLLRPGTVTKAGELRDGSVGGRRTSAPAEPDTAELGEFHSGGRFLGDER